MPAASRYEMVRSPGSPSRRARSRSPGSPGSRAGVDRPAAQAPPKKGFFAGLFGSKAPVEIKEPSPERPPRRKARGFEPLGVTPARSRRSRSPDELEIAMSLESSSPPRPPRPRASIGPDGKRDAHLLVQRITEDRRRREIKLQRMRAELAHLDRRPAAPPRPETPPLKLPPDDPTFKNNASQQVKQMFQRAEEERRVVDEAESTIEGTRASMDDASLAEECTSPYPALLADRSLTDGEAVMLVAHRTQRFNTCDAAEDAFRWEPPQVSVRKNWVMDIRTDDRDAALATIEARTAASLTINSKRPERFGERDWGPFDVDLTDAETGKLVGRGCRRAHRYTIYDARDLEEARHGLYEARDALEHERGLLEEAQESVRTHPGDQERVQALYRAQNGLPPFEAAVATHEARVRSLEAAEEPDLPRQTYAHERSKLRTATVVTGCATADDPWYCLGPLLTAASLRLDLAVSLRPPYWGPRPDRRREETDSRPERPAPHVQMTYACPCGVSVDRAFRDDHRRTCRLFRESWEELLRRLVDQRGRPVIRRLVARVAGANLCDEAAAFCALAICGGDAGEAVKRLGADAFRTDCAVAAELHGLAALDPGLRRVYVVGDSQSGHTVERNQKACYRISRHKIRVN